MKKLIIIAMIIALCLCSVWALAAIYIGTGGKISFGTGGTLTLEQDNGIRWDASGDVILWDSSGDQILWD